VGPGLINGPEKAFHRNGLKKVHTVIDRGIPQNGEVCHGRGWLFNGLKCLIRENGSRLLPEYFQKAIRGEGEKCKF
jgi:hypothetical protein